VLSARLTAGAARLAEQRGALSANRQLRLIRLAQAESARRSRRVAVAVRRLLGLMSGRLTRRVAAAEACHPRTVLRRGYSVVRSLRAGEVIRSPAQLRPGQRLEIEARDGTYRAAAEDPRQPGLFDDM
jgi:exodeoxyribonuclease VII large subunit